MKQLFVVLSTLLAYSLCQDVVLVISYYKRNNISARTMYWWRPDERQGIVALYEPNFLRFPSYMAVLNVNLKELKEVDSIQLSTHLIHQLITLMQNDENFVYIFHTIC